nr:hypothetical protein [Candidatus Woesebacteria bacterium]
MKTKISGIDVGVRIWLAVLLFLIVGASYFVNRLVRLWPKETLEQKLEGSIARETQWFLNNQKEAGDFVYERASATGEINDANNIVRQAGALYGLGQAYGYKNDPKISQAFEKDL